MEAKIVELNVGGQLFTTTADTLTKFQGTMLYAMFKGSFTVAKHNERFFIDRDGSYFSYILNYLRDSDTPLPEDKHVLDRILREAEFYNIAPLVDKIKVAKTTPKRQEIEVMEVVVEFKIPKYHISCFGVSAKSFQSQFNEDKDIQACSNETDLCQQIIERLDASGYSYRTVKYFKTVTKMSFVKNL